MFHYYVLPFTQGVIVAFGTLPERKTLPAVF